MENILVQLTPAFAAYLIALIYRNTRTSCVSLSSLHPDRSHDSFYRLLYSGIPWSRRLWDWFACTLISEGGYLIIDDTSWQRWTKKAEAVSYVWDSSVGKAVLGMQVVLLLWTDGQLKIPVGIRIWRKGGPSKIKLSQEMLSEAKRRGIKPKYVLFDSWYTAASLLNLIESFGWKYVARIKGNRMMEGKQLRLRWRHRFGSGVGKLRKVNHQVKVVKDGRRFFVSNDLELNSSQVKRIYRVRQLIEETFRLLKQEFGWAGCSAQKQQGQWAHLHLGLYALCLTQLAAREKRKTIYEFKRELFREVIPTQTQFFQQFRLAA